nr:MAG TPA: hypothetical protein [Caudoviricetes sp.]DAT69847.1 MAG TPA: hypothetical protein [Caudoviricetes sp.]
MHLSESIVILPEECLDCPISHYFGANIINSAADDTSCKRYELCHVDDPF